MPRGNGPKRKGYREANRANHAAAAALVNNCKEKKKMVYIAKNEGFDDKDVTIAPMLEKWIRAIANTSKHLAIKKYLMWQRSLEYSRQRLDYVSELD